MPSTPSRVCHELDPHCTRVETPGLAQRMDRGTPSACKAPSHTHDRNRGSRPRPTRPEGSQGATTRIEVVGNHTSSPRCDLHGGRWAKAQRPFLVSAAEKLAGPSRPQPRPKRPERAAGLGSDDDVLRPQLRAGPSTARTLATRRRAQTPARPRPYPAALRATQDAHRKLRRQLSAVTTRRSAPPLVEFRAPALLSVTLEPRHREPFPM